MSTLFRLVVSILWLAGAAAMAQEPAGRAIVSTGSGTYAFEVELAETPDQRAQGLMHRRELADDAGMLFDFQREQDVHFWMKNTYVSLDMIFIKADGTVAAIARDTPPLSTDLISPGIPVRYVLEVVAGTANRIGLKAGDRVLHAAIGG